MPACLLLLVTIIGIPLIPLLILLIIAAVMVAGAGVDAAVGHKLGDAFGRPISSIALAVLVGGFAIAVVQMAPIGGALLAFLLGLLAFGAVWMTGFGTHPDWFANRVRKRPANPPVTGGG